MIKPVCDCCTKELDEPGALIFGPPDKEGYVKKYHVCVFCFASVMLAMFTGSLA